MFGHKKEIPGKKWKLRSGKKGKKKKKPRLFFPLWPEFLTSPRDFDQMITTEARFDMCVWVSVCVCVWAGVCAIVMDQSGGWGCVWVSVWQTDWKTFECKKEWAKDTKRGNEWESECVWPIERSSASKRVNEQEKECVRERERPIARVFVI